jgi:hypothetical protein
MSESSLEGIWEWVFSSWITWNEVLKAKRLYEELIIIQKNAHLISEEDRKIAEESKTEEILRISLLKQEKIKEEIQAEKDRLKEFKAQREEEKEIYKWIDDYRTTLETKFTTLLETETKKRINALERIRRKAIATANALARAWITNNNNSNTNNNNVNVNLQGTGYSWIDAQNIWNALTEKIDLSSKWIN